MLVRVAERRPAQSAGKGRGPAGKVRGPAGNGRGSVRKAALRPRCGCGRVTGRPTGPGPCHGAGMTSPSGAVPRPKPLQPVTDVLIGLVTLALEAAACVPVMLGLGLQGLAGSPGDGGPPPMDWGPTIAFGVIAALAALGAFGFGAGGMPVSAFLQGAAALVLVFVALGATNTEHHRSHPAPRPASTWAPYTGPVCYSGGDNCP